MYIINISLKTLIYTSDNLLGNIKGKKHPFLTIGTENTEHLRINSAKNGQNLYEEDAPTDHQRSQLNNTIYQVHGWEDSTSQRCQFFLKLFCEFIETPIKTNMNMTF